MPTIRICHLICVPLFVAAWLISTAAVPLNSVCGQEESADISFVDVKPILRKRCTTCHGRNDPPSGLDLTTLQALQAGSESGPIVVAGKPEQSLLYTLSAHIEEPIMPPGKDRIPEAELEVLREWISGGMDGGSSEQPSAGAIALKPIMPINPVPRPTAVTALAASPVGDLVAMSGLHQVVLFNQNSMEPLHAYPYIEGDVFDLEFSSDGKLLAVAGGKGAAIGKAILLDVASGDRLAETPEEYDAALSVAMTGDSRFMAWGGPFREARVLDRQTGQSRSFQGATDWVLSVAVSPQGRLVAGGDRFGGLRVWNVLDGKVFWTLRGHTGAVTKVIWSEDGDKLLSAGKDGTCRLWDLHTGTELKKFVAPSEVWAADWRGNLLAVGGRNKKAIVWDLEGKKVQEVEVGDEVSELALTSNKERLLIGDASGALTVVDLSTGTITSRYSLPVQQKLVKVELPWPIRTRPIPAAGEPTKLPASPRESLVLALDETEATIAATEANLERLKETAQMLRQALKGIEQD